MIDSIKPPRPYIYQNDMNLLFIIQSYSIIKKRKGENNDKENHIYWWMYYNCSYYLYKFLYAYTCLSLY